MSDSARKMEAGLRRDLAGAAGGRGGGRVARRFLVTGRVTGVGFRYFTQDVARREGVTGIVRNLPDGRVEVIAEGETESLTRLEAALRRGPSHARVEHVEIDALPVAGHYLGFAIE
jgi:acylphosphatase